MTLLTLYIVTGIPVLIGLAIIAKEAGWPSERERNNRAIRSFRSALGGTPFLIGLGILIAYKSQPSSLVTDLSFVTVLRFVIFIVVPTFCTLLIGSFVQYWSWDKTEPLMKNRLRKIVEMEKKRNSRTE